MDNLAQVAAEERKNVEKAQNYGNIFKKDKTHITHTEVKGHIFYKTNEDVRIKCIGNGKIRN